MSAIEVVGGAGADGSVSVHGKDNTPLVELLGRQSEAVIGAGNKDRPGRLTMYDGHGAPTISLTTADATVASGGGNAFGTVSALAGDGSPAVQLLARATEAVIGAGHAGRPGRLTIYDGQGQQAVNLTTAVATGAALTLGGGEAISRVSLLGHDGKPSVELLGRDTESVIGVGQTGRPGRISVYDGQGNEAVRIDSADGGDIALSNGDLAEEFAMSGGVTLAPGTLVVIASEGDVEACGSPYDTRVAGVVAGAGNFRPALILDRRANEAHRASIAVLGKAQCMVDADAGPIAAGDLLTTSSTPGHAMRVGDRVQAMGAIVGKALAPLSAGQGMIPILVTLQ